MFVPNLSQKIFKLNGPFKMDQFSSGLILKQSSEPKPLTIGLDPLETFDSSGFIHQEFR